jgi:amicyanin
MAGFEFTIPITLSRYFGHRGKPPATVPPAAQAPPAQAPAPAAGGAAAAGAAMVRIANLSFTTKELQVHVGTRVRWVNQDQLQHSVTADDGSFDSGLIEPGQSYERVFAQPGSYAYHCTPHPFMTGKVVVEP